MTGEGAFLATTNRMLHSPRRAAAGVDLPIDALDGRLHHGSGDLDAVLVVNPDDDIRESLAMRLARAGYRIVGARGFGEALEALRHGGIRLVVAAVRLGEYNGLHLAVRLSGTGTPVLITNATPDAYLGREASRLGAEFVTDPENNPAFLPAVGILTGNAAARAIS